MSRKPFNLPALLADEFKSADREQLDKAHEIKFKYASPAISDDDLRARLVAAFQADADGLIETALPPTHHARAPSQKLAGNKIPNLRPTGKWEGRMRRVTIRKKDQESKSGAFKIGWEGVLWAIAYDTPVDMPWPYWESLKNTDFLDDRSLNVTKFDHAEDGQLIVTRTPRWIKTVMYDDHGDVPGTENLPESYFDFYLKEARRTNCFEGFSRQALMMIHNTLIEPKKTPFDAVYFRDMKDVDIRLAIAQVMGPEILDMMNNAVYDDAAMG